MLYNCKSLRKDRGSLRVKWHQSSNRNIHLGWNVLQRLFLMATLFKQNSNELSEGFWRQCRFRRGESYNVSWRRMRELLNQNLVRRVSKAPKAGFPCQLSFPPSSVVLNPHFCTLPSLDLTTVFSSPRRPPRQCHMESTIFPQNTSFMLYFNLRS